MLLRVQHLNDEYNYVSSSMLDKLIASHEIRKFYRPSEKRWITIGVDPVRGAAGSEYKGPERRLTQPMVEATVQAWLTALSGTA